MRLHIAQSNSNQAKLIAKKLRNFQSYSAEECDVIVALGGDGFMLRCIHQFHELRKPIFGINCGTVGFLMNDIEAFDEKTFLDRIKIAEEAKLHPLKMVATTLSGNSATEYAVNEVSLFRQTSQTSHLKISINGNCQLNPFMGDGVIIASPAGSTAYNRSAHGPIIPLKAPLMALTPICALKPREWRGALLDNNVSIEIEVIKPHERPVSACADYMTIPNIEKVNIITDFSVAYTILFDPGHNLERRILNEQFV